jgi:hypothetical protein
MVYTRTTSSDRHLRMSASRLQCFCVLGAVVLTTASQAPAADPFSAGVLSCAAESDRGRRLDCYDRAVASYTAAIANYAAGSSNSKPASPTGGTAAGGTAAATVTAAAASRPSAAGPGNTSPSGAAPEAPAPATPAPASRPPVPIHFAAHIVGIDHFPDYVVVHLDNQQTWKQVSEASGALMLRNGDAVTIDKQMGSHWLAGPKGEAVQVKLETP